MYKNTKIIAINSPPTNSHQIKVFYSKAASFQLVHVKSNLPITAGQNSVSIPVCFELLMYTSV